MGKTVKIYSLREQKFVYVELIGSSPYVDDIFAGTRTKLRMGFCWKHGYYEKSKGYRHGQSQRCPKCEKPRQLKVTKRQQKRLGKKWREVT